MCTCRRVCFDGRGKQRHDGHFSGDDECHFSLSSGHAVAVSVFFFFFMPSVIGRFSLGSLTLFLFALSFGTPLFHIKLSILFPGFALSILSFPLSLYLSLSLCLFRSRALSLSRLSGLFSYTTTKRTCCLFSQTHSALLFLTHLLFPSLFHHTCSQPTRVPESASKCLYGRCHHGLRQVARRTT